MDNTIFSLSLAFVKQIKITFYLCADKQNLIKNTELFLRLYHLLYAFDMIYLPLFVESRKKHFKFKEEVSKLNLNINPYAYIKSDNNIICCVNDISFFFYFSFIIGSYLISFVFQEIFYTYFGITKFQTFF